MRVFWSWQSDSPQNVGKLFVRDALSEVVSELSDDPELDPAERPDDIDHDTRDVPGSPPIAETILLKIREAGVFVADVTPVATSPAGRRVPNPNVMIELGYALAVLTNSRIVLVMNTAEGAALRTLPFDLRHWRGPVCYSLRRDATQSDRQTAFEQLKEDMRERLRPCLRAASAGQSSSSPQVELPSGFPPSETDKAVWSGLSTEFRGRPSLHGYGEVVLAVPSGPRLFVRVIPLQPFKASRSAMASTDSQGVYIGPLRYDAFWTGVNELGASAWATPNGSNDLLSVTQWVQQTGEFWGLWFSFIHDYRNAMHVSDLDVLSAVRNFLKRHIAVLENNGAVKPYSVRLGIVGLRDTLMPYGDRIMRQASAVTNELEFDHVVEHWSDETLADLLYGFATELYDAYGVSPPSRDRLLEELAKAR